MTLFTGLFLGSIAIAAIALVKARPGTLLMALNSLGTVRALQDIKDAGQPPSQAFVPSYVFSDHNLTIASNIFLISTLCLGVSVLIPTRPTAGPPPVFPPLPRWATIIVLAFLAVTTVATGNLLSHSYIDEAGSLWGIGLGGLNAMMLSLCLYEIVRRGMTGQWSPLTAFLVLGLILFVRDYSKGSTGMATGYGMAAALMLQPIQLRWPRRLMFSVVLVAAVGLTAFVVRATRYVFHERGFGSVTDYFEELVQERSQSGDEFNRNSNSTQYASHVLECVELYETGHSREWRSIYNPIVYTFEPSFLLEPLGITRPKEAAWELADYYIHGGGIFLQGELYWNGGYLCVFLVFGFLAFVIFKCDTNYRRAGFWLMLCAQFVPTLLMGGGYGFAQVIRGAINGLVVVGLYRLLHPIGIGRWLAPLPSAKAGRRGLSPRGVA